MLFLYYIYYSNKRTVPLLCVPLLCFEYCLFKADFLHIIYFHSCNKRYFLHHNIRNIEKRGVTTLCTSACAPSKRGCNPCVYRHCYTLTPSNTKKCVSHSFFCSLIYGATISKPRNFRGKLRIESRAGSKTYNLFAIVLLLVTK